MKRIICLILTAVFCIGLFSFPAFAEAENTNENLIYALNIMEKGNDESPVSRAEMVKAALALLGVTPEKAEAETGFDDVAANHPYAVYIKAAKDAGMISAAQNFEPERAVTLNEALKMLVFTLGYDRDVLSSPEKVSRLAASAKINVGIKGSPNGEICRSDAVRLISNTLNATLYGVVMLQDGGSYSMKLTKSQTGATLLTEIFKIAHYEAYFEDDADSKGNVKVKILRVKENKKLGAEFKQGDIVSAVLSEHLSKQDLKYITANIYMDNDGKIFSLEPSDDLRIIYGVIDEVNKNASIGTMHDVRYIENIAIVGEEDYLDIADGCNFFFNEKQVKRGGYPFVSSYARLILEDDEIVSVEAWALSEGGIISSFENKNVVYTRGTVENIKLDNLGSFENVKIILNGAIEEIYALGEDVFFDYYISDDEKSLFIVGSTRAITDELTSYARDSVYIGGDEYSCSPKYNVYYADKTGGYIAEAQDLVNQTVTAYIDAGGYVRYVKYALEGAQRQNFYGVITGYDQKRAFKNPEAEIYCIADGKVERKTFSFADKVKYEDGLSYADICTEVDKIHSGSDLSTVKLLYRFKLNLKQEIAKVEKANLFDMCPESGITQSEMTGGGEGRFTSGTHIYFDGADMCAIYRDDDGVQVKSVPWSDLQLRSGTGITFHLYSKPDSSEVDLVLIRGDLKNMLLRSDYMYYGLLSDRAEAYDAEKDRNRISFKIDGSSYYIDDETAVNGVTDYAFVLYSPMPSFIDGKGVIISQLFNLSGEPEKWQPTVINATTEQGFYSARIERWDKRRIYFDNGKRLYMGDGMPIYKISNNGKLQNATLGEMHEGAEAWYIYDQYEIRGLIFR